MRMLASAVTMLTLFSACAQTSSVHLSTEEEAAIASEVREAFQEKSDAIRALDVDRALEAFDSVSAVHLVDGQMFVGMEEIGPAYRQGLEPIASFIEVDITREELEVFAPNAASYAFAFDESFITESGDTVEVQGVWTLVFGKVGDSWRVVHSSASHGGG